MKYLLVLISFTLLGCSDYSSPKVTDITFRGHKYIVFKVRGRHGQTYVHDPDCPCGKK